MSEKHRNLPPWMIQTGEKSIKANTVSHRKRAKRSGQKESAKRSITYWMNEAELVETALSLLKYKTDQTPDADVIIPETDTSDCDGSDSDCDVTERETLQYDTRVDRSNLAQGEAGDDDDDEALDVVRGIFFNKTPR